MFSVESCDNLSTFQANSSWHSGWSKRKRKRSVSSAVETTGRRIYSEGWRGILVNLKTVETTGATTRCCCSERSYAWRYPSLRARGMTFRQRRIHRIGKNKFKKHAGSGLTDPAIHTFPRSVLPPAESGTIRPIFPTSSYQSTSRSLMMSLLATLETFPTASRLRPFRHNSRLHNDCATALARRP